MMISIPPKYEISEVVGLIKGKRAIRLARVYGERKQNFVGQHFWARGYIVSTVGRDCFTIKMQHWLAVSASNCSGSHGLKRLNFGDLPVE